MAFISKEDYDKPCCPFTEPDKRETIPVKRIIEKLDEYFDKHDFEGAKRHLKYWLSEAEALGDIKGKISVLNEQIGLYRKLGIKDEALSAAEKAISFSEENGFGESVSMGTTLINAATAYVAFDMNEKAMPLYRRAEEIYEKTLDENDSRLGGLYNNSALAHLQAGQYDEARKLFNKALSVMSNNPGYEPEQAITYCNLADLAAAEKKEGCEDEISACLEKAKELLDLPSIPRDGYYAFVCDKCAPVFGYYGFFGIEKELKARSEEIYERL